MGNLYLATSRSVMPELQVEVLLRPFLRKVWWGGNMETEGEDVQSIIFAYHIGNRSP